MAWYGNGPAPENRFYGQLSEDTHHREYDRLHNHLEKRKLKLLREKYPNLASLDDEIADHEDSIRHQTIVLEELKEERELLAKLYGVDDV